MQDKYSTLIKTLSQINELLFLDETTEICGEVTVLRPSIYSLRVCNKIILNLAEKDLLQLPSDVCTDRNGNIHISWKGSKPELVDVDLICPPFEKPIILCSTSLGYYDGCDLVNLLNINSTSGLFWLARNLHEIVKNLHES